MAKKKEPEDNRDIFEKVFEDGPSILVGGTVGALAGRALGRHVFRPMHAPRFKGDKYKRMSPKEADEAINRYEKRRVDGGRKHAGIREDWASGERIGVREASFGRGMSTGAGGLIGAGIGSSPSPYSKKRRK